VGKIPRVVGTLSSLAKDFPTSSLELPSDIVELRLDIVGGRNDWLNRCVTIEAGGSPVILTIRLPSEGGKWSGTDKARLKLYSEALENLSCVDVELRSEIATSVAKLAKNLSKACIVSFHDFDRTPALKELEATIAKASKLGSIVKIATMVKGEEDLRILSALMQRPRDVPICVIGMGSLGAHTRATFTTLGSCMTYGYLDKPSAPGQLSASELANSMRKLIPAYNQDFSVRKQVSEYA